MDKVLEVAGYVIVSFIKLILISSFIHIFIKKYNKNKYIKGISYVVCLTILSLSSIYKYSIGVTMLINFICISIIMLNYKEKVIYKLHIAIFILSIIYINSIMIFNTNIIGYTQVNLVFLLSYIIINKIIKIKKDYNPITIYSVAIFAINTLIIYVIFMENIKIIYGVLFFVTNALGVYIYKKLLQLQRQNIQSDMRKGKDKLYEEQIANINKYNKDIRSLNHDYKNHIMVINGLIKSKEFDKSREYIEKICNISEEKEKLILSDNVIINIILNSKIDTINKQKIYYKFEINIPENFNMDIFDITTILGNLIDNAVEATIKESNKNERYLHLILKVTGSSLSILCKNSFDGITKYKYGKIASTKGETLDTGIGIFNIRAIVDKYDGNMEISHDDKYFISSININI